MAQRRMFSMKIIDTDLFLDMPSSSQLLYFHLAMRADDDGFIGSPKKIIKMVNCSDDDLKILEAKQFIIPFDSGICVIKHWRIHNYIRTDRYNETIYTDEKAALTSDENGTYTRCIPNVIPNVNRLSYQVDTQVRLGKDRLGKVSLERDIDVQEKEVAQQSSACSTKVLPIITEWNGLGLQKVNTINRNTNRYTMLKARINEYGIDKVLEAIKSINNSSFLKGQNNRGWTVTFDWFVKPNNFQKVVDGNYLDKVVKNEQSGGNDTEIERTEAELIQLRRARELGRTGEEDEKLPF